MALEKTSDDSVLLVAGSTDFGLHKGEAILQAVSFDRKLSYISDLKVDERPNRYISKIRKVESTNKFFAATIDAIYVFEFKNRKFYKLTVIGDICQDPEPPIGSIMDLVFHKNILYALKSGEPLIYKIKFA